MNDEHGHLSPAQAAAYARRPDTGDSRKLSPAERLAASDHLAACAACRALVTSVSNCASETIFTDLLSAAQQDDHSLDDGWQTDAALPSRTHQEQADLLAFEAKLNEFEPEKFAPGGTRSKITHNRVNLPGEAPLLGAWWRSFYSTWGTSVGFATAAVVILAVLVPRGMRHPSPTGPVAQTSQPPPNLVDGPLTVQADGALSGITSLPAELRDAVLETIRRGAAPGALLGTLTRGESGTPIPVAPEKKGFEPETPTGVIETDRPVFRWKSATDGEVIVQASAGGSPIASGELPSGRREWIAPKPFARGQLYRWQVRQTGAAAEVLGGMFKVLSTEAQARLEALRTGSAGNSHLALGVAYAREGMHVEAREEFRRLQEENGQSALAQQLLKSSETWR